MVALVEASVVVVVLVLVFVVVEDEVRDERCGANRYSLVRCVFVRGRRYGLLRGGHPRRPSAATTAGVRWWRILAAAATATATEAAAVVSSTYILGREKGGGHFI